MHHELPSAGPASLKSLLDALPSAVVAWHRDGRVLHRNAAADLLLSLGRAANVGQASGDAEFVEDLPIQGPRDAGGGFLDGRLYRLAGRVASMHRRAGTVHAISEWIRIRLVAIDADVRVAVLEPSRGGDERVGEPRRPGATDWCPGGVSALAIARQDTGALDPGTGLPSRATLVQIIEAELSRSRRYSNPFCILVFELPRASRGPRRLDVSGEEDPAVRLGQFLREETRWADSVGRWNGNQFLLVLPETNANAARVLAAKLATRIRETDRGTPGAGIAPERVLCGCAEWRSGDGVTRLTSRALSSLGSIVAAGEHRATSVGKMRGAFETRPVGLPVRHCPEASHTIGSAREQ